MDGECRNGDQTQRARLTRLLADPASYFAAARRRAHAEARRLIATELAARGVNPARQP